MRSKCLFSQCDELVNYYAKQAYRLKVQSSLQAIQPSTFKLDLSLWGSEYPQNFLKIVQVTDNPPDRQRPDSEQRWCC
jgi:hypothetical protein